MENQRDANWQSKMKLGFDFNNMMDGSIDASGQDPRFRDRVGAITQSDIQELEPLIESARELLKKKWGKAEPMLAWTELPVNQDGIVKDILEKAEEIRAKYKNFVVLGIGGSALGPIAVHQALRHLRYNELSAKKRGGPKFYVEDNVDPERMKALFDVIDAKETCFNVITKSGGTSETMSQLMIVFDILEKKVGSKKLADHIVATTDAVKGNLKIIADRYNITQFVVPDGVGGRFSELSPVGLLPAAVCGIDIRQLLEGAAYMAKLCVKKDYHKNPGWMAGILAYIAMTKKGKNVQVVIPYADSLKYMADWYAQLWAESLGKRENLKKEVVYTGQTPVKALGVTDQHSQVQLYTEGPFDKTVTFLCVGKYRKKYRIPERFEDIEEVGFLGGHTLNELIDSERVATEFAITKAGKLNQTVTLPEVNEFTVGQLLYFFMVQTAVCGELLGIDAYNQPGVEEGKKATFALLGRKGFEAKRAEIDARPSKNPNFML